MNRDNERQSSIILSVIGILPIVWLGLLIAPSVKGGLPEILPSLMTVFNNPFHIELCGDSVKTVLVLLLCYGMGIGIYFSTRRNYRRREEHGSAKWGNARAVDKKYRQNPSSANKLMTQNVKIGLNAKKHRRNLNTLVCGGSGAGKTRFYCKPNLMQANTSFVILDPKGEILRDTGRLLEAKGYEKNYRNTFVKAFEFADDGYVATYDDFPDATKAYPGGTGTNSGGYGSHNPCFEYNAEDRLYYRSQWGEPHTCALTGEQLTVSNVIFKVCKGSLKEPGHSDYLDFVTDGSGKAYIFTNGKVIEGTWERKGAADPSYGNYFNPNPTLYYDKNGNEVVLNQGKTWICCIWDEYEQFVSWE